MNRAVFEAHLLDLLLENGLDACRCKYMISQVYEEGKKYTSKDDFMRLNVFPTDKIKDKIYSFDEVVQRFLVLEPYYPIWIDVYVKESGVIELKTSMRYRRPSELWRRETGKEPFMFGGVAYCSSNPVQIELFATATDKDERCH